LAGLREKAGADTKQWAAVREARKRIETLAASELADPGLVRKVQTLLKELETIEADRRMIARLEGIRVGGFSDSRITGRPDTQVMDHYVLAFRDYGIPVGGLEVEEAARRVKASAIRDDLVAALDKWAGLYLTNLRGQEWNPKFVQIARRV